ncbi:hypothetical protein [Pseudomonas sp. D1-36]|uniref:hypothetical protein n=1 Tax=Pseudomonas sp. D1-36 TaxID=2817387 RepID=UPI003DA87DE3
MLTLTLLLFVVFICHTSSYNMGRIICGAFLVVNWPLPQIFIENDPAMGYFNAFALQNAGKRAVAARKNGAPRIATSGAGHAMTGVRH